MNAELKEHQIVLTKRDQDMGTTVSYANFGIPPEAIYLPKQIVEDMGSPEQITVSVKPGDHLT